MQEFVLTMHQLASFLTHGDTHQIDFLIALYISTFQQENMLNMKCSNYQQCCVFKSVWREKIATTFQSQSKADKLFLHLVIYNFLLKGKCNCLLLSMFLPLKFNRYSTGRQLPPHNLSYSVLISFLLINIGENLALNATYQNLSFPKRNENSLVLDYYIIPT